MASDHQAKLNALRPCHALTRYHQRLALRPSVARASWRRIVLCISGSGRYGHAECLSGRGEHLDGERDLAA